MNPEAESHCDLERYDLYSVIPQVRSKNFINIMRIFHLLRSPYLQGYCRCATLAIPVKRSFVEAMPLPWRGSFEKCAMCRGNNSNFLPTVCICSQRWQATLWLCRFGDFELNLAYLLHTFRRVKFIYS
jgi:hypothetical protein